MSKVKLTFFKKKYILNFISFEQQRIQFDQSNNYLILKISDPKKTHFFRRVKSLCRLIKGIYLILLLFLFFKPRIYNNETRLKPDMVAALFQVGTTTIENKYICKIRKLFKAFYLDKRRKKLAQLQLTFFLDICFKKKNVCIVVIFQILVQGINLNEIE